MFLNVQGRGIAARWRAPQAADESRRTGRRPQASRKRSPPKILRLHNRNRRLPAHDEAALREAESFRLAAVALRGTRGRITERGLLFALCRQ